MLFHSSYLKSHQINLGLLSDNEYVISRRIHFCQQFWDLWNKGYNMYALDETYVNGQCCQLCFSWVDDHSFIIFFQQTIPPAKSLLTRRLKVLKK